ncbi:MAG: hypothetical protein LBN01_03740 [Endomicrobium sp.]|jgi:hypothetical protein|nr:hypothetical protein [Endomicrobium sp.]
MLYLTSARLNLPMCNSNSAFLKASLKLPAPLTTSNKFLASGIILFAASATSSKEIFESTIEICPASRFEELSTLLSNRLLTSSMAAFFVSVHTLCNFVRVLKI